VAPPISTALECAGMRSRQAHSEHIRDQVGYAVSSNYQRKLVGRDGIEPPTPGFSDLYLGIANGAKVLAA